MATTFSTDWTRLAACSCFFRLSVDPCVSRCMCRPGVMYRDVFIIFDT